MPLATYAVYDVVTGQIFSSGECNEDAILYQPLPGQAAILTDQVVPNDQYYVDPATQELLPVREMSLTVIGTTISGLPPTAVVTTAGQAFPIDDGIVELMYDFDGTYDVTVRAPTFKAQVLQVTQVTE